MLIARPAPVAAVVDPPAVATAKVRLLLADNKAMDGTALPIDGILADWNPPSGFVGVRRDAILVDCELFDAGDGLLVPSLMIRPFFYRDDLCEALYRREPIPVVAYWRRFGFRWSPRSVDFAERFRLGVGGALMATLVPLLGSYREEV
jgi:hypothetical protein